ncbi:MAG: hypothetical protein WDM81_13550, partial [Rhizomicrobium sp.]
MADFVASVAAFAVDAAATVGDAAASAGSWVANTAGEIGGAGAGAAPTTLEEIRGGMTIFQGLSSIAGGAVQAGQLRTQAAAADANARGAVIAGKRATNDATDQLLDTVASQRVALAASGVDSTAGVGGQIFGSTFARGDFVRGQTALDAAIQARTQTLSGRALMAGAGNALATGFVNAGMAGADYFARRTARG